MTILGTLRIPFLPADDRGTDSNVRVAPLMGTTPISSASSGTLLLEKCSLSTLRTLRPTGGTGGGLWVFQNPLELGPIIERMRLIRLR